MKTALLAWVMGIGAMAFTAVAEAKVIDSPDVRQIWTSAELHTQKFYWNVETHRLEVALTYAAAGHPEQTANFHFPHVRPDADGKQYVLDLGNGKTVAVAHRLFLGGVILERNDHLVVHHRHGVVRVALDVYEGK